MGGMIAAGSGQRVGLALGGGAVRGAAHLGVLTVLERERIPIDLVVGTSAGALAGVFLCAGLSTAEMVYIGSKMNWRQLARPVWPRHGLLSFKPLGRMLEQLLGPLTFDQLETPFATVATDAETGEMVILQEGPVAPAVVASCSVPGFFEPVRVNGRLLCDGGIINNLPVSVARQLGADYVIGVDIFEPRYRTKGGPLAMGLTAIEVLINQAGMGCSQADCLIRPRMAGLTYMLFNQWEQMIAEGVQAAERALPDLRLGLLKP